MGGLLGSFQFSLDLDEDWTGVSILPIQADEWQGEDFGWVWGDSTRPRSVMKKVM